jgi:hypothetical protein
MTVFPLRLRNAKCKPIGSQGGRAEQIEQLPEGEMLALTARYKQQDLRGDMRKRGKVLRDPHAGPGLLMVEGRQYQFLLESVWKSEGPPKPGLAVEVDFGQSGQILAISVVPESQLAQEQEEAGKRKKKRWPILGKMFTK